MLTLSRRGMSSTLSHTSKVVRSYATALDSKDKYKVVVVGGGSGGLSVANQIYNRFKAAGKTLNNDDIAIIDAAEFHYYQPGWTLVGSGLRRKTEFKRSLQSLIPSHLTRIPENVQSFSPEQSAVKTTSGRTLSYDVLVVASGIKPNWDSIAGLPSALADPSSGVSSIYSYDTCDKVWKDVEALKSGRALFTQPAGVIKCPGAPQKIMWMTWDRYQKTGRGKDIQVDYRTGMPTMFSVKKYSDELNKLRIERGVGGEFQQNLVSIDAGNRKATFQKTDGSKVVEDYTLLHAVPVMGPMDFLKGSPIADAAGWVEVDPATLRHVKPEYGNIFALGDCTNLPTARTAAAITSQAPVLTENLFSVVDTGDVSSAKYDGYSSCPLLTGYGELMLCEFKYPFVPKESFAQYLGDQTKRRRIFYHMKKDLFPWAYWNRMIKGTWYGPNGIVRPKFS
ncbi:sulfide-quinone oxidoreductase [Coniophora puteana RWD-64-598 SS2]|uniref:Sulfide:quinone oxidoreductase, mitochondrial n=1 Tax=Coniophora puteana (strain RWD-64-598) TaxID=741705 RepID=A0A5M3MAL0_CONPW|nr:sulfide-quinone oxidoreductase [Coniophora puteana RWD-64-598 SS2]EIW76249.1 sulfide-quinone oxidoreductase [Coniophora puteana RWD-64-598 SS2]